VTGDGRVCLKETTLSVPWTRAARQRGSVARGDDEARL